MFTKSGSVWVKWIECSENQLMYALNVSILSKRAFMNIYTGNAI